MLESVVLHLKHNNMAINVALVKNLVFVKGPQVAVNFGEGGSEGLPRSGTLWAHAFYGPLRWSFRAPGWNRLCWFFALFFMP